VGACSDVTVIAWRKYATVPKILTPQMGSEHKNAYLKAGCTDFDKMLVFHEDRLTK
jgi:hypothetical protein